MDSQYQILYRFSKKTGIPVEELEYPLVKLLTGGRGGKKDNLEFVYRSLRDYHVFLNSAKRAHIAEKNILRFLVKVEANEVPQEILDYFNEL